MTGPYPKVSVNRRKLLDNFHELSNICFHYGASLVPVTKPFSGSKQIFSLLCKAGAMTLGDSQIINLKELRSVNNTVSNQLIRTPMLSQVKSVINYVDVSYNSDLTVVESLSIASIKKGLTQKINLVCEIGDERDGVCESQLLEYCSRILQCPGVELVGVSGVIGCNNLTNVSDESFIRLIRSKKLVQKYLKKKVTASIGGSSVIELIQQKKCPKGIDEIRIGEALALGTNGIGGKIDGLHNDTFILRAEVIEIKTTKTLENGQLYTLHSGIIALGYHILDIKGLTPCSSNMKIGKYTSDHMFISTQNPNMAPRVGEIFSFIMNYRSLVQGMTSKYLDKVYA